METKNDVEWKGSNTSARTILTVESPSEWDHESYLNVKLKLFWCISPANKIIFIAKNKEQLLIEKVSVLWKTSEFRNFIRCIIKQKVNWSEIKIAYNLTFHGHPNQYNIREFLTLLSMWPCHHHFQPIQFQFKGFTEHSTDSTRLEHDRPACPWIHACIVVSKIISPWNYIKSLSLGFIPFFCFVSRFSMIQSSAQGFCKAICILATNYTDRQYCQKSKTGSHFLKWFLKVGLFYKYKSGRYWTVKMIEITVYFIICIETSVTGVSNINKTGTSLKVKG